MGKSGVVPEKLWQQYTAVLIFVGYLNLIEGFEAFSFFFFYFVPVINLGDCISTCALKSVSFIFPPSKDRRQNSLMNFDKKRAVL